MNKDEKKNIFRIFPEEMMEKVRKDERSRALLTPQKIVWETRERNAQVLHSEMLLETRAGQISLESKDPCIMVNDGNTASVLLDFGREVHGGILLSVWKESTGKGARIRVRFGESVGEAMSELGGTTNATNDHATRDMIVTVGSMSMNPIGETGFRFVRIDFLEPGHRLEIKTIQAILIYKDLVYQGSFRCSDPLLNRIWDTGAYTVHLNIQEYIWDGIKRDRLVWAGDLHPEIMAIRTVFGYEKTVPKTLDFVRDETPLPGWMNGFPAYSMWWAIIQHDWFWYTGDIEYLKKQKEYLKGLADQMSTAIDERGKDITPETRFVDWPSKAAPDVVDAGLQAIHIMAAERMRYLFEILNEDHYAKKCAEDVKKMMQYKVDCHKVKQAAALLVLAGIEDPEKINQEILSKNGSRGVSTFMGYYILSAMAEAGNFRGCLDCVREYWGGMLALGATSFWEDFDIEWMKNAQPIDQMQEEGKIDVHGSYGGYCYSGYRHSLCHGWAAGVTPWMSEYILGVKILEPGCRRLRISPRLVDLEYAEGTFPTPMGSVRISHKKNLDGTVESVVFAPEGITVEMGTNER